MRHADTSDNVKVCLPIAPRMTQALVLMSALVVSIVALAVIKAVVTRSMLYAARVRWADVIILADIFAYSIDQLLGVRTGFDRGTGWWLYW